MAQPKEKNTKIVEREETVDTLLSKHFDQPDIDSSNHEDRIEKETINTLYECPQCNKVFKDKKQFDKHYESHQQIFYCWVCQRTERMQLKDFNEHLLHHENNLLTENNFLKTIGSKTLDHYEKRYEEDSWVYNPLDGSELDDIFNVLKISIARKNHGIVYFKMKVWFVTLGSEEDENTARSSWQSLTSIQSSKYDITLKTRLQDLGHKFIAKLCDQDNVDGGGSGFIFVGISDVSITVVKNLLFGCKTCSLCQTCESCFNCSICTQCKCLDQLTKKDIIFNPTADDYCFQTCIKMSLTNCPLYSKYTEMIIDSLSTLKKEVTLEEVEKWIISHPYINLQIFLLTEINNKMHYHPILLQKDDNAKVTINLIATFSSLENKAHFILLLDLQNFLSFFIYNYNYKYNYKYVCNHCYVVSNQRKHVIERHELYCRENPKSMRFDDDGSMKQSFEFPEDKKALTLNVSIENIANAPNWYGFLDFETVSENVHDWFDRSSVCSRHRLLGKIECNCPATLYSDKIQSLSYFLTLFDFNSQKKVFEKFYIQKTSKELSCGEHLAYTLKNLSYKFELVHQLKFPIEMSEYEKKRHAEATHCQSCKRAFMHGNVSDNIFEENLTKFEMFKLPVRKHAHHLHHKSSSNFVSSLCGRCNLAIQSKRQQIPIYCHNLAKFDHVFFFKSLLRLWPGKVKVLSTSQNNILAIRANPFYFKDSLSFIKGSLDKNVALTKKACEVYCENCNESLQCKTCKDKTYQNFIKTFKSIYDSDLSKVNGCFNKQRFLNNLQKAAFPYSILTSYENLSMITEFPERDKFFSIIKGKKVEETSYQCAKEYFETYCHNMLDFLEIYNKLDCYLLHAVWKVQSDILYNHFEVYLENFATLPSYSLEIAKLALYKENDNVDTGIELFSEKNKDIYFTAMQNIRGGVVFSKSKFELNSAFEECLNNSFSNCEFSKESDEDMIYIDACNLYGYSLSSQLPFCNYEHVSNDFIERINQVLNFKSESKRNKFLDILLPDEDDNGFTFEIEVLNIPEALQEFPPFFAPQKVKSLDLSPLDLELYQSVHHRSYMGNKNATLLPIMECYGSYFTHYKLLKAAIKEGAKVKVKSGISFKQKYLFRNHISKLSKLRSTSKNPAHKQALKLASNSLFGKMLQSVTKYSVEHHFAICDNLDFPSNILKQKIAERNYSKNAFILKDLNVIDEDFIMLTTQRISGLKPTNCPLIAFCILEIAKWRNFEFYWRMKKLAPCTKLLYSDTDSFILKINKLWYEKMRYMQKDFDFSEFPTKAITSLGFTDDEIRRNKGEIGLYKSELAKDVIFVGFISLQKKAYCLLLLKPKSIDNSNTVYSLTESPTARRIDASQLKFKNYIHALSLNQIQTQSRWKFAQHHKSIHMVLQKYTGLSAFDESNYTKNCGFHNIFISSKNSRDYICQLCGDERRSNSLSFLKDNINEMQKGAFFFQGDKLVFDRKCKRKNFS